MVVKMALRTDGTKVKPYLQDFKTDGKRQREFAENYGEPNGRCVRQNVSEGMSQSEIRDAVRECAQ